MKANNLSISMPYLGCDRDCPFCVSKMTGYMNTVSSWGRMIRNVGKVLQFAKSAQVTSVSITGKGEPMMDMHKVYQMVGVFSSFPVELQTNGILLKNNMDRIEWLYNHGLDVLAISIYSDAQMMEMNGLIHYASELGLIPRITFIVTKYLSGEFREYINWCKIAGARQVSFRNATIPKVGCVDTPKAKETIQWIKDNVTDESYKKIKEELWYNPYPLIRKLPYGATIFDVDGIAVTCFDYCMQDNHKDDDIRSLIFQEDGHLYSTWNSEASIIF